MEVEIIPVRVELCVGVGPVDSFILEVCGAAPFVDIVFCENMKTKCTERGTGKQIRHKIPLSL